MTPPPRAEAAQGSGAGPLTHRAQWGPPVTLCRAPDAPRARGLRYGPAVLDVTGGRGKEPVRPEEAAAGLRRRSGLCSHRSVAPDPVLHSLSSSLRFEELQLADGSRSVSQRLPLQCHWNQRLDFLMTEELSNSLSRAAGSRVKPCAKLIFQQA